MSINYIFLLLLSLIIQVLSSCADYYLYQPQLQDDTDSSYFKDKSMTRQNIPQKQGFLVLPLLSKAQIFSQRFVNLNKIDVDNEYQENTTLNYDYVMPLCINNLTFMTKIDFDSSVVYLAGDTLQNDSYTKYLNTNSLTHELIYHSSDRCIVNNDLNEDSEQYEYKNAYYGLSNQCTFRLTELLERYQYFGDYILDELYLDAEKIKNKYTLKSEEKFVFGIVKSQDQKLLYKNINGLLGLGFYSQDQAYSESFLNKIEKVILFKILNCIQMYNLNGNVFSLCLNTPLESGGYLIIGGINKAMYTGDIHWINFSKINSYIITASSIHLENQKISKQQDQLNKIAQFLFRNQIKLETKTPFIVVYEQFLQKLILQFIQKVCINDIDKIKGLCNQENHILQGSKVIIPNDLDLTKIIPPLIFKFNNGEIIQVNDYIRKCNQIYSQASSNEWCSLIKSDLNKENNNQIIFGSSLLRQYYIVIDNQFARVGFAQRKGIYCDPKTSNELELLNDNNLVRLVFNALMLVIIIIIGIRVTGGCLQFYDLNTTGNCQERNGNDTSRQEQQNQGNEGDLHNFDQFEESSYADESSMRQQNQEENKANIIGERHQTQTFRPEDYLEFEKD